MRLLNWLAAAKRKADDWLDEGPVYHIHFQMPVELFFLVLVALAFVLLLGLMLRGGLR